MSNKLIEIACVVKVKTSQAWLILDTQGNEAWIPISKIDDYTENDKGAVIGVIIPDWLATDKGLIS